MGRGPESQYIPDNKYRLQKVARAALNVTFPGEVVQGETDEIAKASELLKEGYGLFIPTVHFSGADFIQLMAKVGQYPEIGKRGALIPIGLHELKEWIKLSIGAVGVDLMPIVTESTRQTMGEASPPLMTGLSEFAVEAGNRLQRGGVVVMAIQGKRMPTLGEPRPRATAMWSILQKARPPKQPDVIPRVAVMPVGLRLKGKPTYDDRGFHFRERFEVAPNKVETVEEILGKIEGATLIKKYAQIEAYVYDRLREVAAPEYR